MSADQEPNASLDPSSFDGRLLVEIKAWDGNLHVGLSSELTPLEYRFQGGLSYVRAIEISGRVVAPAHRRAKRIRLWLSPFGPDMKFGAEGLDEVGQLHIHSSHHEEADFSATLLVPEAALPLAATCLGSVWRYVHIWTFDDEAERASVGAFSFSATIHGSLETWARS